MSDAALAAVRRGLPVIIPTDTVYGLAASPFEAEFVARLYAVKGRALAQPTALVAADVDVLLEVLPELEGRGEDVARALLPGALTLVLPNPARRFPWLTGERPDTIGVRVPALTGAAADLLRDARVLAATSANLPGGADPRRLQDVPLEILDRVAAAIDGGELPGTPSTVVDLTGAEPKVIREGAVPASEVVERVLAAYS